MTHYDYKVVPAPRRCKRVKGMHTPEELFAVTLAEAINEVARQGWEYVRAETLHAESPHGWFRRATVTDQSVLIFRRERDSAGPRLSAVRPEPAPPHEPEAAVVDRVQSTFKRREPGPRREPRLGEDDARTPLRPPPPTDETPTPLRPAPRLGPAEKP